MIGEIIPGHRQEQLTHTLIVSLWGIHLFSWIQKLGANIPVSIFDWQWHFCSSIDYSTVLFVITLKSSCTHLITSWMSILLPNQDDQRNGISFENCAQAKSQEIVMNLCSVLVKHYWGDNNKHCYSKWKSLNTYTIECSLFSICMLLTYVLQFKEVLVKHEDVN